MRPETNGNTIFFHVSDIEALFSHPVKYREYDWLAGREGPERTEDTEGPGGGEGARDERKKNLVENKCRKTIAFRGIGASHVCIKHLRRCEV